MNATHLHLLLNHVPVLGTIFGLGFLAFALWRRNAAIQRAALSLFLAGALAAVPTYLTGEPAEDAVESMPGVTHQLIEQHEEVAAWAMGGVLLLGIVALGGLVWFRRQSDVPRWFGSAALIGALLVSGVMAWTASLGGQIRHTEIRVDRMGGPPSAARPHRE